MEYRKSKGTVVVRLDDGDEIVDSLKSVCRKLKIKGALVSGIGAAKSVELGSYNTKTRKYHRKKFEGHIEIVALNGNIATMYGVPGPHLHATIGLHDLSLRGGHLFRAEVMPTCEIVILPLGGQVKRKHNENHELYLLNLK